MKNQKKISRRSFIKNTTGATYGPGHSTIIPFSAFGANEKVQMAVLGVNGRGQDHNQGLPKAGKRTSGLPLRSRQSNSSNPRHLNLKPPMAEGENGARPSPGFRRQECGCRQYCHAKSLAYTRSDLGDEGRQGCLRGKNRGRITFMKERS